MFQIDFTDPSYSLSDEDIEIGDLVEVDKQELASTSIAEGMQHNSTSVDRNTIISSRFFDTL